MKNIFSHFSALVNWFILSICEKQSYLDCHGSIIYLVLINRLMPYVIAIVTQIEQYQYVSYKLVVVGFRFVFRDILFRYAFVWF